LDGETDSETVQRLGRIPPQRILPEAWRLRTPASPHLAAELDDVLIRPDSLSPPETSGPLVIEGAGGLLVPLTRRETFASVFERWQLPVILCARTTLGTINHTLLSLEALQRRSIPVLGVAFIGDENRESQAIIAEMSGVRTLGRLPMLDPLTPETLRRAFDAHFERSAFSTGGA
jgi:dethiobiotin synthetase